MPKREIWNSRAVLWPCKDCGCEVSPVRQGMRITWCISDKLWKKAGMKPQGRRPLGTGEFLCIGCLEARIGRALTVADFMGGYTTRITVRRKQWRRWLTTPESLHHTGLPRGFPLWLAMWRRVHERHR